MASIRPATLFMRSAIRAFNGNIRCLSAFHCNKLVYEYHSRGPTRVQTGTVPASSTASYFHRAFHSSSLLLKAAAVVDLSINDLKKEIQDGKLILIDVRNIAETESTGVIPNARVLPLPRLSTAMRMEDSDFEAEYGFSKPQPRDEVAVYCRSGVRAVTALDALVGLGYQKVKRYPGGWLEWADNHPGLKREPDGQPA